MVEDDQPNDVKNGELGGLPRALAALCVSGASARDYQDRFTRAICQRVQVTAGATHAQLERRTHSVEQDR